MQKATGLRRRLISTKACTMETSSGMDATIGIDHKTLTRGPLTITTEIGRRHISLHTENSVAKDLKWDMVHHKSLAPSSKEMHTMAGVVTVVRTADLSTVSMTEIE